MSGGRAVNIAALRARLWSAKGDLPALAALNEELSGLAGPGISGLQQQVAQLLAARSAPPKVAEPPPPPPPPKRDIPADLVGCVRARARAAGQPLYRYGVTDAEFAALRSLIQNLHRRGDLEQANDRSAAAFVIYCAEWFRREYDGGGYSWDAPFPAALSQQARKNLAIQGLAWWGRKPRRSAHRELRLMSLALEGGFPTRLLESRENGRITQHLFRLLVQAEGTETPSEDAIDAMSRSMGASLGTYDHPEFHALCADLVVAILALRAEALAEAPAGVPAMAWLDGSRPEWREELPIVLPGERARRLLDALVSATPGRISGDGARATRLLVAEGTAWVSAARLRMAGDLDLRGTMFRPVDGRLRVRPTGALSGAVAGELGIIEPPAEDAQHWLCRPRGGADFIVRAPFDVNLELELRAGSNGQALVWPGGAALRSEVLIFADEAGDEAAGRPRSLALVGQGSVKSRRSRLYCATGAGYRAEHADGGPPIRSVSGRTDMELFEAVRAVLLTSPGGDVYRVDPGADEDTTEHLVAEGNTLKDAESLDHGVQLFLGAPRISIRSGTRSKPVPVAELSWRRIGAPTWRPWGNGVEGFGLVDVAWRDGPSGVLRDRLRFAVLPADLAVTKSSLGRFRTKIELAGAASWSVLPVDEKATVNAVTARSFEVRWPAEPQRRLLLNLAGPNCEPIRICVRPRYSAAAFFSSSNELMGDRARIMVEDLRGANAFGEGPEQLYMRAAGGGDARFAFTDETPLWALSEDVARLLSASRDLDDEVTIEFGRSSIPRLTVGRYSATIGVTEGVVLVRAGAASPGQSQDRRLEWFSILEPHFHELAKGREFAPMPGHLVGPGMAVLRKGGRIIGRPTFVPGKALAPAAEHCELQLAALGANAVSRTSAIKLVLDRMAEVGAAMEANHVYVHRLLAALDGLPPSALDLFRELAGHPSALAAVLAGAPAELRGKVWGLERDLPFLWCTAPVRSWMAGFNRYAGDLTTLLTASNLDPTRVSSIVDATVRAAAEELAALDPGLRVVMTFCQLIDAGHGTPPTIYQAAQSRVARSEIDERDLRVIATNADPTRASCFRQGAVRDFLPSFAAFLPIHWQGLDAACACALAAADKATLSDQQVVAARAARAEEPIAFNDMFAAALSVLARGNRLECTP